MHVCLYVCLFACMYVCVPVCVFVCLYVCVPICVFVGLYVCLFACMFVGSFVCTWCRQSSVKRTRTCLCTRDVVDPSGRQTHTHQNCCSCLSCRTLHACQVRCNGPIQGVSVSYCQLVSFAPAAAGCRQTNERAKRDVLVYASVHQDSWCTSTFFECVRRDSALSLPLSARRVITAKLRLVPCFSSSPCSGGLDPLRFAALEFARLARR